MINDNELRISNMSYTNKDFVSIYRELLDIVTQISPKWNPVNSNESDPGIVLLKLASFIGDKNNYNIDKNILEAFMPSATQETSMRELCEIQGYNVKYYTSATTAVAFEYTDNNYNLRNNNNDYFTIPAFTTVVANDEGDVKFTLTESVEIHDNNKTYKASAIEGSLFTLNSVNTSKTVITLADLTDRRIYFPVKDVASNGVFIFSFDSEGKEEKSPSWTIKDNLNTLELGQKVYKFGFDSNQGLPYIEFPADISDLIGEGIVIRYIETKGLEGNIKAYTLSKISSDNSFTTAKGQSLSVENIKVVNYSSTVNGTNSETIDEAYNNFKKTIGTFETLVTCRDYANAIYNLASEVVSNVQVADRRTDLNYSRNVMTYDAYGSHLTSLTQNSIITPYDLCLYSLNAIKSQYDIDSYISSFKPCQDLQSVKEDIEDYKTISHNYKELSDDDIYLIKNYYKLNVKIYTYNKVDVSAQKVIIEDVKTALYKKFNARNVDYGQEIPYDILYDTIKNANANIKEIILDEPELSTAYMNKDEAEHRADTSTYKNNYYNIVARNVLEGRISLFDYDDSFSFDYGETNYKNSSGNAVGPVIKNLVSINTEVTIAKESLKTGYTLRENEVIQFIAPNYTTEIQYIYGVYYNWNGTTISKDEEHLIVSGEKLTVRYTDSTTKKVVTKSYDADSGKIIKPNFDLTKTEDLLSPTTEFGNVKYAYLSQTDTIDIRKEVSITLDINKIIPVYWIRDNQENRLFTDDEIVGTTAKTILGANEYFIYSNEDFTTLNIFSSGTKLTMTGSGVTEDYLKTLYIDRDSLISADTIDEKGLAAFNEFSWQYGVSTSQHELTVAEMQLYTFGEDTEVTMYVEEGANTKPVDNDLTNEFKPLTANTIVKYTIDGEEKELSKLSVDNTSWEVRSRLDLNVGSSLTQTLGASEGEGGSSTQSITFKYIDDMNETQERSISGNVSFNLSALYQRAGGNNIPLLYKTTKNAAGEETAEYLISAKVFKKQDYDLTGILSKNRDGYYNVNVVKLNKTEGQKLELPVTYISSSDDYAGQLVMIYLKSQEGIAFAIKSNSISLVDYVTRGTSVGTIQLKQGINIIKINAAETSTITLVMDSVMAEVSAENILVITPIKVVNGINDNFNINSADIATFMNKIKELATKDNVNYFNYITYIDNQEAINADDLSAPEALWDENNIANKFTLPEIDFDNSSISIIKSSRL